MSDIPQQFLIGGTVLFLFSLLVGFAIPALANPRMGVSVHIAGLESGLALWAFGLMWHRVALPATVERFTQILTIAGLYAVFLSLLLAALWGTSRATPIAGAGHSASAARETIVSVLLGGGSIASAISVCLLLWGLLSWKA